MVQLFHKFNPISVLFLYLLNWVLKIFYLTNASINIAIFNTSETGLIHFPFMQNWAINHTVLYIILSIHINFLMAIFINYILIKHKLASINTLLPAFSFVLVSSLLLPTMLLSVYTIISFLLLWSLSKIFDATTNRQNIRIELLEAGVIFGLVLLAKPLYILFLLFYALSIIFIKAINVKDIIAFTLGTITPYFILLSIYWILSPKLLSKLPHAHIVFPYIFLYKNQTIFSSIIVIAGLLVAQFNIIGKMTKQPIQIIKKWQTFRFFSLFIFICSVCTSVLPSCAIYTLGMVVSILIFPCFNMVLKTKTANFTALLFVIIIFLIQFLVK